MSTAGIRAGAPFNSACEPGSAITAAGIASASWDAATALTRVAGAGAVLVGSDAVAAILRPSGTFEAMLEELGKDWTVRIGRAEADAVNDALRVITVRVVTERLDTRRGYEEFVVDKDPATASKVVASVADALRRREIASEIPRLNVGESEAKFVERYVAARAGVDVNYYARVIGVTSDVYNEGLTVNRAMQAAAKTANEPPPEFLPPVLVPVAPVTPGITQADVGRYAELFAAKGLEGMANVASDIARRPATREAYQKDAREAFAKARR